MRCDGDGDSGGEVKHDKNMENNDSAKYIALHSALVAKRSLANELLWQVPTMSFTAQAFLLSIAFDIEKASCYRVLSGMISCGIGCLCWQLFLRHSALELQTSKRLQDLEKEHFPFCVHTDPKEAAHYEAEEWADVPSRKIWNVAIPLIAVAGLVPIFEFIFICGK